MKLRIKGNTIRLRLTRSEVEYFASTSHIEEQTEFGDTTLSYTLKTDKNENLTASFDNNNICVYIPEPIAKEWLTTNMVGCNGEMDIENGKKLYLLIEKDFKCLDETTEDQSDNYENPLARK
jgi:hypothetical protein